MGAVSELIRSERLAFIDFLETLTPDEWAVVSLCPAWTVQDVAAHLAWAPVLPALPAAAGMLRSGFRLNTFIADSAARWSMRGPGAILDQLRANAASGATPTGLPEVSALTDAIVHALDVRRPLERPRPIPREAFVRAAEFSVGLRWPLSIPVGGSTRKRVAGLHLQADDLDWSHGRGAPVRGSAEALMLVLTGRPVRPDELTGPGAPLLLSRITAS